MSKEEFWKLIDGLDGELELRYEKLHDQIKAMPLSDLLDFHEQALNSFREIFCYKIFQAYLCLYYGESNEAGFNAFCSNVIVGGSMLYSDVRDGPDRLPDFIEIDDFNEDYDFCLPDVVPMLLEEKVESGEISMASLPSNLSTAEGIFDGLKVGGSIEVDFEPDMEYIKANLPRLSQLISSE